VFDPVSSVARAIRLRRCAGRMHDQERQQPDDEWQPEPDRGQAPADRRSHLDYRTHQIVYLLSWFRQNQ
jgi:hypothetical protein